MECNRMQYAGRAVSEGEGNALGQPPRSPLRMFTRKMRFDVCYLCTVGHCVCLPTMFSVFVGTRTKTVCLQVFWVNWGHNVFVFRVSQKNFPIVDCSNWTII